MKKYFFSFTMRTGEKVMGYETDDEPPKLGDVVRFDDYTYKIVEICSNREANPELTLFSN